MGTSDSAKPNSTKRKSSYQSYTKERKRSKRNSENSDKRLNDESLITIIDQVFRDFEVKADINEKKVRKLAKKKFVEKYGKPVAEIPNHKQIFRDRLVYLVSKTKEADTIDQKVTKTDDLCLEVDSANNALLEIVDSLFHKIDMHEMNFKSFLKLVKKEAGSIKGKKHVIQRRIFYLMNRCSESSASETKVRSHHITEIPNDTNSYILRIVDSIFERVDRSITLFPTFLKMVKEEVPYMSLKGKTKIIKRHWDKLMANYSKEALIDVQNIDEQKSTVDSSNEDIISIVDSVYEEVDIESMTFRDFTKLVKKILGSISIKGKKHLIKERLCTLINEDTKDTVAKVGINIKDSESHQDFITKIDTTFKKATKNNINKTDFIKLVNDNSGSISFEGKDDIIEQRFVELSGAKKMKTKFVFGHQQTEKPRFDLESYMNTDIDEREPNRCIILPSHESEHYKDPICKERLESYEQKGFKWGLFDKRYLYDYYWDRYLEQLIQYKEENGHCVVPESFTRKDCRLGEWVKVQRRQYKLKLAGKPSDLSDQRIDMLNAIEFVWAIQDRPLWHQRFEELKQFKLKHNHCDVPQHYEENPELGSWCSYNRSSYRRLMKGEKEDITAKQIALLEGIGFKWNMNEDSWKKRFNELLAFKDEFGHTKVPKTYKNRQLGSWVNYQRSQYKYFIDGKKSQLTQERIQLLNSIGFVWNSYRKVSWEHRFEEFKQFKQAYGHVFVPSNFAKNPKLGGWVGTQRDNYRSGSLEMERIAKLESEGFSWNPVSDKKRLR